MKVPQNCIKMKAIYSILLIILSHQLIADSNFYVTPMTLEFPSVLLTSTGPIKQKEKNEITLLGNFLVKPIELAPKKSLPCLTPFSVLENLLYIFQYSDDFKEISNLLSPSLSENARNFYMKPIAIPQFKLQARKTKGYAVYGYFLDKNTCVVFYSKLPAKRQACARFILEFKNGKWYLGDQMRSISQELRTLASFISCFPDDIQTDLKIIVPPTLENLALLATDLDTISFYNKLAVFYGLTPFQKFIEKRLNE